MLTANDFWNWFKANNTRFLVLNDPDLGKETKEELLDGLLEHLHEYCDKLYFAVGGWHGDDQELIITADGDVDYFDKVDELIDCAPILENWNFTAFMQPHELDYTSHFEDVILKPLEMYFLPLNSSSKPKSIGLKVCLANYQEVKDSEWLKAAVYRVLDTVLGEKAFALDVDYIDIGTLPDNPEEKGMMELKDLSRFIKWKKAKLANL
jgi:hypothetical protein